MTPIPDWQKQIHVLTEAASLLLVPVVLAAAKDARPPHKGRLKALAAGMLIVDGFLLLNWLTKR